MTSKERKEFIKAGGTIIRTGSVKRGITTGYGIFRRQRNKCLYVIFGLAKNTALLGFSRKIVFESESKLRRDIEFSKLLQKPDIYRTL